MEHIHGMTDVNIVITKKLLRNISGKVFDADSVLGRLLLMILLMYHIIKEILITYCIAKNLES